MVLYVKHTPFCIFLFDSKTLFSIRDFHQEEPLAQSVEQLPFKQWVQSSILWRLTWIK